MHGTVIFGYMITVVFGVCFYAQLLMEREAMKLCCLVALPHLTSL